MKLYLLPYAGSGAMVYNQWKIEGIECVPIEYSGHGFRYQEPLLDNEADIIDDIMKQIDFTEPYAIFGHSMGGLLTWLTVKCLACCRTLSLPERIFISACEPPNRLNLERYKEFSKPEAVIQYVRDYKRISDQRINTRVFKEVLLPVIQNDFHFLEKYDYKVNGAINCGGIGNVAASDVESIDIPAVVIYSGDDTLMSYEFMEEWMMFCTDIKFFEVSGDHFYIEDDKERILEIIKGELD